MTKPYRLPKKVDSFPNKVYSTPKLLDLVHFALERATYALFVHHSKSHSVNHRSLSYKLLTFT